MERRLTIAFLDENGNDEYHSLLMQGVFDAAKTHNAQIVRIGHFLSNETISKPMQVLAVHSYVKQLELDGLIFLGWGRFASSKNEKLIKENFPHTPLLSIGTGFPDIPVVWFDGDSYIEELLLHLIHTHDYQKIAFIEPYAPDSRHEVYKRVMKQKGLSDPVLVVGEEELRGLTVPERGSRAVEILLKDRGIRPEAIMSLYNAETECVIKQLNDNGLRVPEDVAVTSFEDGELGMYGLPAYTTVLFPWKELGRVACDLFLSKLKGERETEQPKAGSEATSSQLASVLGLSKTPSKALPMNVKVAGKVVIRESCGCKRNSSALSPIATEHPKAIIDMTEYDLMMLADSAEAAISLSSAHRMPDCCTLIQGFAQSLITGNRELFLKAIQSQLDAFSVPGDSVDPEPVLEMLRNSVLPHVSKETAMLIAAEDLFMQAAALLAERGLRTWGERERNTKRMQMLIDDIGQSIISQNNLPALLDTLEAGLNSVGIQNCLIGLTEQDSSPNDAFVHCKLVFRMQRGFRYDVDRNKSVRTSELLKKFMKTPKAPERLVSNLLHVGNEISGFAIFSPGPLDERLYRALSYHISTAIYGIFLSELLGKSVEQLVVRARKEGKKHASSEVLKSIREHLSGMNSVLYRMSEIVCDSPFDNLIRAAAIPAERGEEEVFFVEEPQNEEMIRIILGMKASFLSYHASMTELSGRLQEKNSQIRETLSGRQSKQLP